ncbi:MAG TPA: FAD-binding oxidoreductase [Candidatus Binataceae bacterium]|nr:FAD-binding oxidoreductase [Candidatus Binataceae bacterium]
MSDRNRFEVVIVGAGIAGSSLAHFLAERGLTDVLLLERETQPGYHATGRSAASLVELDPNLTVQALKVLGGRFLRNPPEGFSENLVLRQWPIMFLYRDPMPQTMSDSIALLEREKIPVTVLSKSEAVARVPVLLPESFGGAVLLPEGGRIDVHELLSSYLRNARKLGVRVRVGAEVRGIRVENGRCAGVITADGEIGARMVVDAAGAWAGKVSALIGAAPIKLEPRRRTIIVFAGPDGMDFGRWPFVVSDPDHLYFTPESGGLLLSPMDEVPLEPCDAHPDDLIIAQALERLRKLAPQMVPHTIQRKWAGLRTFSPDGVVVVGEDPLVKGFFWLAGQAGYGIESSAAVSQIAADLIVYGKTERFDPALLAPSRFLKN